MAKFKIKFFLLAIVFMLISACANQPIMLKPGLQPKVLELCLNFSREIDSEDKLLHLNAINTFIDDYNTKTPDQQIQSCTNGKQQTVNLIIQKTRYVTPEKQALYVIVSALGIAYPLSGGSFGFIWIGGNTTNIGIKLSDDISGNQKTIYRQFSSSPYFLNLTAVKKKQLKEFQVFLFELFDELNKKQSEKT